MYKQVIKLKAFHYWRLTARQCAPKFYFMHLLADMQVKLANGTIKTANDWSSSLTR